MFRVQFLQMFGNSLRYAEALLHLGILLQIFHQIKHVTSHSSPAKCFAFLFSKVMDCLSFDKVRVKGEVLKAVRKLLVKKDGVQDLQMRKVMCWEMGGVKAQSRWWSSPV